MTPTIRKATEADLVYVRHSWDLSSYSALKSQLYHSGQAEMPPHTLYKQLFKRWQSKILAKASCVVAANPEDADQLLGYCVYEPEPPTASPTEPMPPVLHYVQVKTEFWRQGVCRQMLAHAGINESITTIYSFGTTLGSRHLPKIWTHVPYYLQPQLEKK